MPWTSSRLPFSSPERSHGKHKTSGCRQGVTPVCSHPRGPEPLHSGMSSTSTALVCTSARLQEETRRERYAKQTKKKSSGSELLSLSPPPLQKNRTFSALFFPKNSHLGNQRKPGLELEGSHDDKTKSSVLVHVWTNWKH